MNSAKYIVFEHPLNERYRFLLRLEFLFDQIGRVQDCESVQDSHFALCSLLDLMSVISRVDIKSETIKELERIHLALSPLQNTPNAAHEKLEEILATLKSYRSHLYQKTGQIDLELREIELLKVLQQRNGIAGALCDFDLPLYRHWLSQPPAKRAGDLRAYLEPFSVLHSSVQLILQLVRGSTTPSERIAEAGMYKQALDASAPIQLIIVMLPADSPCYSEFSGSKHRFSLRFIDTTAAPRPAQTTQDVNFKLCCCIL